MNSGYRWPYGRREGVLPIWAARRAAAPGAQPFQRVIFQNRTSEGLASRTSIGPVDRHATSACRSTRPTTKRDALDAVSCASVFTSDKGRFITEADVGDQYAEPYEAPRPRCRLARALAARVAVSAAHGRRRRCTGAGCYDHADVARYAAHAREVMPEIDAVTMATPPGGAVQSMLFSGAAGLAARALRAVARDQRRGRLQRHVQRFDLSDADPAARAQWDSWAHRLRLSVSRPAVGRVQRCRSSSDQVNDARYAVSQPVGRSSWDVWDDGLRRARVRWPASRDDHGAAPASGADRCCARGRASASS